MSPPDNPHRVIAVTTTAGRDQTLKQLLAPAPHFAGRSPWDALRQALADAGHDLTGRLRFGATPDDLRVITAAVTLTARETDRVTHVLVSEPFETLRDFWFPAQPGGALPSHKSGIRNQKSEITGLVPATARVELADLPFVPLRNRRRHEHARISPAPRFHQPLPPRGVHPPTGRLTMNAYTLEPQDLLFFRDGRPIATAGGHGARWPEPSVVFDAIHAALHRAFPEMQPWEHAHRFGRSSDRDLQRRRTQRFGSNRAAGSVWPHSDGAPRDPATLRTVLQSLGLTGWSVALVGLGAGRSAAELRETASDTIAGNPHRAVFGGINDREPSHTKFKVALLASQPDGARSHCLLAVAPNRQVRGHDGTGRTILCEAESLLLEVKPDPARWQQLGSWNHLLP